MSSFSLFPLKGKERSGKKETTPVSRNALGFGGLSRGVSAFSPRHRRRETFSQPQTRDGDAACMARAAT